MLLSALLFLMIGILVGFFIGHRNSKLMNEKILQLSTQLASATERQLSTEEKLTHAKEVKEKLNLEFENLANKIFKEKMSSFQQESTLNLDNVLKPFKDKLTEFQSTVTKYREDEVREATTLKVEIENIFKLNQQLSLEAQNLTRALKGDKKAQGNWGELILSNILESSGLREGEEYIIQGKSMELTNSEGQSLRPDVLVKLPNDRFIIVDSKVTMNSYEKIVNCEDDSLLLNLSKEFLTSIKNHVSDLSSKKYQNLKNLESPDFVLMFIPIEGAFAYILKNADDIFRNAWDKKIILVSPTTLLVTLRTIESIWRQEKQNRYSLDIANLAGDIYDKFAGFMDDLEDLKKAIDNSSKSYDFALNKLKHGKGNLIGKFEKLKTLGAKASKSLEIEYDE